MNVLLLVRFFNGKLMTFLFRGIYHKFVQERNGFEHFHNKQSDYFCLYSAVKIAKLSGSNNFVGQREKFIFYVFCIQCSLVFNERWLSHRLR